MTDNHTAADVALTTELLTRMFTNHIAVMSSYLDTGASLLDATPYVVTEEAKGAYAFKKIGDAFNWSATGSDATSFTHETASSVVKMVSDRFPKATVTSKRDFYTKAIEYKKQILASLEQIKQEQAQ